MNVIGLTGKAGSGKDTVASFLKQDGWVCIAFADALKHICIDYLGLTENDVYTQQGKEQYNDFWKMTNREILQKFGTDALRNHFSKEIWTKIAEIKIKSLLQQGKRVVITDVRFDNEAEFVRQFGGQVFEVRRTNSNSTLSQSEQQHESEQGVNANLVDRIIDNSGTLDDLRLKTKEVSYHG